MKIHILFRFRDGPWGGCNQFLKALRDELVISGNWVDTPGAADLVLFDSFNDAWDVIRWKRRLPHVPFVQRIDGPVSRYRGRDRYLDHLIHAFGARLADGIVFQSEYSRDANRALGMPVPRLEAVILNAPQPVFKPVPADRTPRDRVRLVAASWSANRNKGFDILEYLDRHLDSGRYELTFVGNSPVRFRNIRELPPKSTVELAALYAQQDIFLALSRHDPCSNALVEALAAGLPAVALRSGGHPELVGRAGSLFEDTNDVLACIDRVAADLPHFRSELRPRAISDVARDYVDFFARVRASTSPRRRLSLPGTAILALHLARRRLNLSLDRALRLLQRN